MAYARIVLVIEEEGQKIENLKQAMEKREIHVIHAKNRQKAIEHLEKASTHRERIDLICLASFVAGIRGNHLLREIRSLPGYKDVQILGAIPPGGAWPGRPRDANFEVVEKDFLPGTANAVWNPMEVFANL